MITVYGLTDQYQIAGLNTYPSWYGTYDVVPPTAPASRTVIIHRENRAVIIPYENRTVIIS